jgi:nitrile hydratase beta subunit
MNGPHDMGGMQCFGPVRPERDEPLFHHDWERRAMGIVVAMGATGRWNLDMSRAARESLPPATYLSSSYYEIWIRAMERLLVERGLVEVSELVEGRAHGEPVPGVRRLEGANAAAALARGSPTSRSVAAAARFAVGDRVRTRNMNPPTHTRLPRYCRDKAGTIVAVHGAHVFPDSNARGEGENPQWLYGVRFEARDLFGDDTTATAVHADLWEPYLERA